jgi:hypothetical protein
VKYTSPRPFADPILRYGSNGNLCPVEWFDHFLADSVALCDLAALTYAEGRGRPNPACGASRCHRRKTR